MKKCVSFVTFYYGMLQLEETVHWQQLDTDMVTISTSIVIKLVKYFENSAFFKYNSTVAI